MCFLLLTVGFNQQTKQQPPPKFLPWTGVSCRAEDGFHAFLVTVSLRFRVWAKDRMDGTDDDAGPLQSCLREGTSPLSKCTECQEQQHPVILAKAQDGQVITLVLWM